MIMHLPFFRLGGFVVLVTLAIAAAKAPADIVGSWDFEEASGNTVFDGVGNFDATIGAGTGSRVTTGDFGGNLGQSWDSGTAEVETPVHTTQYDALTSTSIEAWIKWNGGTGGNYWMTNSAAFSNFIHTLDGDPGVRFI